MPNIRDQESEDRDQIVKNRETREKVWGIQTFRAFRAFRGKNRFLSDP
jgi:hypothetical protein